MTAILRLYKITIGWCKLDKYFQTGSPFTTVRINSITLSRVLDGEIDDGWKCNWTVTGDRLIPPENVRSETITPLTLCYWSLIVSIHHGNHTSNHVADDFVVMSFDFDMNQHENRHRQYIRRRSAELPYPFDPRKNRKRRHFIIRWIR